MQEFYTLVTDVGGAAIANATILGQKVSITNFAVGDGAGNYYTPTTKMTELKREVWRGKPTSVEIDPQNANIMVVSTVIPAEIGGFTIREMGLFAEDGKLIAISNCPDLQKVTLDTGVASELALTMQIAVSNTETIEFKVDPTVIIATKADVEEVKKEIENPEFDDSGTVEGINSFTDFMNKVKSKMNIFDFYRNFKTGLKYIVHTGQIINTQDVTQEGFALDARQANPNIPGSLGAKISDLNNNIISQNPQEITSFPSKPIKPMDYTVNHCTDGTFPAPYGYLKIRYGAHRLEYNAVFVDNLDNKVYTNVWSYTESSWRGWKQLVTNSDLRRHAFSFAYGSKTKDEAIQAIFYQLPNDNELHFCSLYLGGYSKVFVQKYNYDTYGSVLLWGYGDSLVQYKISNGVWYKNTLNMTTTTIPNSVS